ncbi:TlpA disulfide reductase family protein [uncultured Bacteroides sp.]|uniref:TlpA family protein disulfide reductase n=1 Tax=uncultured Bacteroides sp. TaxID=162156 RepID=UPI002670281F|nr:TlpA disulfide reductase family protein [uncultured Bacteroides sp.]
MLLRDAYDIYDPYFEKLYGMLSERDKSRGDIRLEYENRKKRLKQQSLAGRQYVDFTLVDSLGCERKISDYVGKSDLLFLDFWASWCGPCRAQEPQLVRLYQEYRSKGFEILGVSLDANRTSWLSVLRKKENHWTDLCIAKKEDDKRVRELYSINGIPYGILIDKSGKIVNVVTAGWVHLEMLLKGYYKGRNEETK